VGLAFPNHHDLPTFIAEALGDLGVALDVPSELFRPIVGTALRLAGEAATSVLVPKTAVNEDHLPSAGEDQVRRAGEVSAMETKTIT
jgi:hypothetical protein